MNGDTSRDWGRRRGSPRQAGILAAAAGIALLIAACGGSTPTSAGSSTQPAGSTSTAPSARSQQALAYAQCMRSHGVADFPDPGPGGRFGGPSSEVLNNPHFATANSTCQHLLPNGGASGNKVQQNLSELLQLAQCMRSHGVPDYPDPNPNNAPVNLAQLGINQNSPQFQAATRTCERLYPPPTAPPSQRGGS